MRVYKEMIIIIIDNLERILTMVYVEHGYLFLDSIHRPVFKRTMLGGSLVTTAWRVLRLRMEGTPSRYGG
jgi:hypothetical protein